MLNIMKAMSKYLDASKINEDKLNDKIEEKLEFISAYFRWTPGGVTKVGSSFDSNIDASGGFGSVPNYGKTKLAAL